MLTVMAWQQVYTIRVDNNKDGQRAGWLRVLLAGHACPTGISCRHGSLHSLTRVVPSNTEINPLVILSLMAPWSGSCSSWPPVPCVFQVFLEQPGPQEKTILPVSIELD